MASSRATTVAEYLAELPPDRRVLVSRVRDFVNARIPAGYEETMLWGMISWVIPLARYPVTYNGQPLTVVALASQKQNVALYLTAPYMVPGEEAALQAAWKNAGKKLDMGKSCLRFKAWDDLVPDAVARAIAVLGPDAYIAEYERARGITDGATAPKRSAPSRARRD